jgi:stage II sporulation protein D
MAAEGRSAAEILQFYFPGTRVSVAAGGGAWHSKRDADWTLWSTDDSIQLAKEAETAWGKARALYPSLAKVQAEVWAMPTTELFRQQTSEPGWVLASTQATRVFLQPENVLRRSGHEDDTLLHEFLHVLVESEASAQTPLWLREGIVEALADGRSAQHPVARVDLRMVDARLARPASQTESQQAHAAAAGIAAALIARNGLETVRTWVRSGNVPMDVLRILELAPEKAAAQPRAPSTQP